MLSDSLTWARSAASRLFGPCVNHGRCTPIQGLRETKLKTLRREADEPGFLRNPGKLEFEGAVVFADKPTEFVARECRLRAPRRNLWAERQMIFFAFFAALAVVCMVIHSLYVLVMAADSRVLPVLRRLAQAQMLSSEKQDAL